MGQVRHTLRSISDPVYPQTDRHRDRDRPVSWYRWRGLVLSLVTRSTPVRWVRLRRRTCSDYSSPVCNTQPTGKSLKQMNN